MSVETGILSSIRPRDFVMVRKADSRLTLSMPWIMLFGLTVPSKARMVLGRASEIQVFVANPEHHCTISIRQTRAEMHDGHNKIPDAFTEGCMNSLLRSCICHCCGTESDLSMRGKAIRLAGPLFSISLFSHGYPGHAGAIIRSLLRALQAVSPAC